MNEKELYQQKKRAQLNEWRAEVDKLEAKASGASAEARLEMNRQVEALKGKIEQGRAKLSQLAEASEEAWDSIRDGVESAWGSLGSAVRDAAAKFEK